MFGRLIIVVPVLFAVVCGGCARRHETSLAQPPLPTSQNATTSVETPDQLCTRLTDIKIITFRGERGQDKTFDAFLDAGDTVVPCLINRVLDESKMKSPIHVPGYAGIQFKTGDLAFFVLLHVKNATADQFLPDDVKKEYETQGVYAYYSFVQKGSGRKKVYDNLIDWHRRNKAPIQNQ